MENHNNNNSIWITMKTLHLQDSSGHIQKPLIKEVRIPTSAESCTVKWLIRDTFNIKDERAVLKLRNPHGSLVPINANLKHSQPSVPYTLEVVNAYQHAETATKSVMSRDDLATYKHIPKSFLRRIERLEAEAPQLRSRRGDIISQRVEELNCKLVFLNKRFAQAGDTDWKGMFRKPPFW